MMRKIISGGQTGAEQGALDAAIKLGLVHGGWISKGRKTESGLLPESYGLNETTTSHHSQRTKRNVMEADGTLIVSHGDLSGSTAYCRNIAAKHDKPWLHIDFNRLIAFMAAVSTKKWVLNQYIQTLNVAGPEASKDPLIYKAVFNLIETVYYLLQIDDEPFGYTAKQKSIGQPEPEQKWPLTLDGAVNVLLERMSLKDRTYIANMLESELATLDDTLGRYMRDQFGLWGSNQKLIDECRKIGVIGANEPADAVTIIIKALWMQLRKTHRLRIVK